MTVADDLSAGEDMNLGACASNHPDGNHQRPDMLPPLYVRYVVNGGRIALGVSTKRRVAPKTDPRVIWVGGLPLTIDPQELHALKKELHARMSQVGRITWLEVYAGVAKVVYTTPEQASHAIFLLNRSVVSGVTIQVDRWISKIEKETERLNEQYSFNREFREADFQMFG